MSGNGRLVRPDAINIQVQSHPGPLAQPASFVIQQPGGVNLQIVGGLTKLEHAAIQIAAGRNCSADEAVEMAAEVLRVCSPPLHDEFDSSI
jgi:hypothetical protein